GSHFEHRKMNMSVFGGCLGFLERQLRERRVRVEQHGNFVFTGDELLKKLQPFALNVPRLVGEAGDISAGPGEARDDTCTERVADGREYDWDGRSCCLCRLRSEGPKSGDQHVRLVLNEFHG